MELFAPCLHDKSVDSDSSGDGFSPELWTFESVQGHIRYEYMLVRCCTGTESHVLVGAGMQIPEQGKQLIYLWAASHGCRFLHRSHSCITSGSAL